MTNTSVQTGYLLFHLVTILLTVGVGYWIVFQTGMRAKRLFGIYTLACTGWVVVSTIVVLVPSTVVDTALWGVYSAFGLLSALTLLVFTAEFTGRDWRRNTLVRGYTAVCAVLLPFALTAPINGVYWASMRVVREPFTHVAVTPGVPNLFVILTIFLGLGVTYYYFLQLYLKSRRRPSSALLVVVAGFVVGLVPFVLSRSSQLLVASFDHTTFGLVIAFGSFAYAASRLDLATVAPVARDEAIENLSDPFFALDRDGNLADFNTETTRVFDDIEEAAVGTHISEVASELVAQVDIGSRTVPDETEVVVEFDGRQHLFDLRASQVDGPRGEFRGTHCLLQNVTSLRRREQELDLLTQVFARTFRHNVRNELSVVKGYVERIRERSDDETTVAEAQAALDSTDRLLGHAEKVRNIEEVVTEQRDPRPHDLSELVSQVVTEYRDESRDTTIEFDVPEVSVSVIEGFEAAIGSAVENALEHNPSPVTVTVSASLTEDTVTLAVEDDGRGIPDAETAVIEDEEETPLRHGSGIGLWLIKWYTEQSDGTMTVHDTEDGTLVEMTLLRAAETTDSES